MITTNAQRESIGNVAFVAVAQRAIEWSSIQHPAMIRACRPGVGVGVGVEGSR